MKRSLALALATFLGLGLLSTSFAATATNPFRKDVRVLLTHTGLRQSTDYTSQSSHCCGASKCGNKPPGCDNRANPRNGEHS